MARFGSVLGGILAEIGRARVIADQLTKDLLAEYELDPVLSSLSVPRVTIGEAEIALRFTVDEVTETEARPLDEGETREAWRRHVESVVLPQLLERRGLDAAERETVVTSVSDAVGATVGRPRVTEIRRGLAGEPAAAASTTTEPIFEAWESIPVDLRRKIGRKDVFNRELSATMEKEFERFVDRKRTLEDVRAALASRLDVQIRGDRLAEAAGPIQEIRLTVRSEDLDLVLDAGGGEG